MSFCRIIAELKIHKSEVFFENIFEVVQLHFLDSKPTNVIFCILKKGEIPALTSKIAIFRKICEIWLQKCSNCGQVAQCGFSEKKFFEVGQLQKFIFWIKNGSNFWIFVKFRPMHRMLRGS